MRKHDVSFEHGGHRVFCFVKELDDTITFDLNRYLSPSAQAKGDYDPSLAQYVVLRRGIDGLKIDRKAYSLQPGAKNSPPRIKDAETDTTVLEHILGHIIRYNPFLVEEEDYREAFEEYVLDDQEVPESDPTPFPRAAGTE